MPCCMHDVPQCSSNRQEERLVSLCMSASTASVALENKALQSLREQRGWSCDVRWLKACVELNLKTRMRENARRCCNNAGTKQMELKSKDRVQDPPYRRSLVCFSWLPLKSVGSRKSLRMQTHRASLWVNAPGLPAWPTQAYAHAR